MQSNSLPMLALTVLLLACMRPLHAQPSAAAVKATYLLHFLSFTTWPADAFMRADSPVRVCVAGEDGLGPSLDAAIGTERVHGRSVQVARMSELGPLADCHVLYVSDLVARPDRLLRQVRRRPVLTIGESDAFWREGGMLRFVQEGKTIRFDINMRSADDARLVLSARLLQVARRRESD